MSDKPKINTELDELTESLNNFDTSDSSIQLAEGIGIAIGEKFRFFRKQDVFITLE